MSRYFQALSPPLVSGLSVGLLIGVYLISISSCGFRLRGAIDLPTEMASVYIQGLGSGAPFYRNLRQSLNFAGGKIAPTQRAANMVLNILEERMDRRQISLTATGKANEFELTHLVTYELLGADGKVIAPAQTIRTVKDYLNQQINVLGKAQEETIIREEIYRESVATFVRRTSISLRNK